MPDPGKGGRMTLLPQWAVSAASRLVGSNTVSSSLVTPDRREPWFGPGKPMPPSAPEADVAGRAYDYPNQINMGTQPRQYEGVSFAQLRGLADSLDIVRLCVETRKDQMGKLTWAVLPVQDTGESQRPQVDDRCREVERFMKRPDRRHTFNAWMRMILEDQLVIDAASIYVRRTVGGDLHSLEVIDGSTIKPILDVTGRMPESPMPAYQQILKGFPAINYTEDELIYAPLNPRAHAAYGLSPVQQLVTTINIAVRREIAKLQYFTEGNIPEALISVPKEWTPEQISKFQVMWNALMASQAERSGAKFVPGDMVFQQTRSDAALMGPFDEWIARVVCYAFSLPPTAFVQQQNRATAESAHDVALEEGLAPMMIWFKGLMDHIIQNVFGYKDLEFVWDDVRQMDVAEQEGRELAEINVGLKSIDEVRAKRGLDPIGMDHAIFGMGPNGIVFVKDLLEAKAAGLLKIQPPLPPQQFDELGNPLPPEPQAMLPAPDAGPAMHPDAAAMAGPHLNPQPAQRKPLALTFEGIPPELLSAVGLGPEGPAGRTHDVTHSDAVETDPLSAHVPHPQVLTVLRDAEAQHKQRM